MIRKSLRIGAYIMMSPFLIAGLAIFCVVGVLIVIVNTTNFAFTGKWETP